MKFTIPCRILTLLFGLSPLSALAANLDQTLSSQPNLSTFRSLVSSNPTIFSNLPQGITILAPNDDAFNRIGNWHSQISSNKTFVSAILKYHILPKEVSMKPIPRGESTWSNTLLTDQGFSTIMGGQRLIMTKLPDEKVVFTSGFATRGTVVTEDIQFDGGLIQVVDGVMRVPAGLEFTMRRSFPDDISAFLGGLFASGLMEELVGKTNDVTIFAPHNSAFQHLASNFEGMKTEEVKKIFRYHIVPGTVSHSWELQDGSSFKTAETGKKIAITLHTNFIFVNSAQVLQSDVLLSNGVVHIIDNVLDPNHQSSKPDMNLVSQTPVFEVKGTKTETGRGVETPWIGWIPCLEGEEGCRRVTVTAVPTTTPTGTGTGTGTGTATGTVSFGLGHDC
ncbi:Periostin [Podospora fimiseda]|uniref:Periostin n=1 Tax=Podospora fimiseda TaxID=252190 RepID=A0AAN7GY25_9PEZI|nr:Periostin [Podospora fimiseda]